MTNSTDTLGDRIKRYERASHFHLSPNSYVIIRVDGRAFHTFTRNCDKPFDAHLMNSMQFAMKYTTKQMDGFRLAYTQSDECSFLITDTTTHQTQPWFDNDLAKLVTITASTFTAAFNHHYDWWDGTSPMPVFDGRAFVVPEGDVPNAFLWRQRDWERNSLQMLARANFTHHQLHEKDHRDIHDMLMSKGINWANLSGREKNGVWLSRIRMDSRKLTYTEIAELIAEDPDDTTTYPDTNELQEG